ncbi:MAG: ATP-binding cassette domain-containing protein [Verrucomicrobiia bacterium]
MLKRTKVENCEKLSDASNATAQDNARSIAARLEDCALVEFRNATFEINGETVFPSTTLKIKKGEQWGIVGHNGSGKSLLIQAILGEILPVSGEVSFSFYNEHGSESDPADVIAVVSAQKQREFILRESSFYQSRWHSGIEEGEHTVAEFLSQRVVEDINPFAVDAKVSDPDEFEKRRTEIIDALGIHPLLKRKILHLSNGEQRKVLLARSLLKKPQILIIDDPYAGLDAESRLRVKEILVKLKSTDITLILISHRLDEISKFIKNLIIVRDYRIIWQGTKAQALRKIRDDDNFNSSMVVMRSRAKPLFPRRAPVFKTVIKVKNLTIRANDKVILEGLDWTVRSNEHWAIVGKNGAGKTTLLNVIRGDHPQVFAQDITLFDKKLESPRDFLNARKRIGSFSLELHQHFPLESSCLDSVCSGFHNTLGLFNKVSSEYRKRALILLEDFGLGSFARTSLGELSVGQQRLVLICRAIVKNPWLLILDEPCQGLDTIQKLSVLRAVDRIAEQTNARILFVTHILNEMPQCITRILKLNGGKYREYARK